MMAHFLGAAPDPALLRVALALDPHNSFFGPGVLYQWCRDGVLAAPPITAGLGVTVTARNWNTVTKLTEHR